MALRKQPCTEKLQSPPIRPLLLLSQPSFRPLPPSLWLLLPLLLSIANAQSIQGFVYWDSDLNGILSEGALDRYGTVVHELGNGIVNVRIEVKQCGKNDGESIIQGLTGWLANSMEIPGNSNIHPKAGYYTIDVSSNVNTKKRNRLLQNARTGCLITNEDVEAINSNRRGDDGPKNNVQDAGCYLIVSSPKDYEITTTFQTPYSHGFHGWKNASSEERNSIVEDIFSWIPYKDIGPFTNNGGNHDTLINRGYQARTSECFGFNKDNEEWYVWQDESSAFYDEKTETDESDHDLEKKGIGAVQIAIPNSGLYGYDRYLSQTSYNYEGVLSISPVGMAKTLWPLPLRVKSNVILGLKFNDGGPFKGRFQFQQTSEIEAAAASKLRPQSNSNTETSSSNVFSSDGEDARNEHFSDHSYGILTDVSNLEDVVQTFLKDQVTKPSGDSDPEQMLISLDVATVEQWSMVKIFDSEASSNEIRHIRRSNRAIPDNVLSPCNLRGSTTDNHRILRSMPTPHTVFYLQVYGAYGIKTTAEVASIIRTVEDFGRRVSSTINRNRDDFIRNIRARTGFNRPECNRPHISTNVSNDDALLFGIGPSSKFGCDDLLPLYYYHMGEVVAREDASHNADPSKSMHLSKALEALKEEDEFYDSNAVQEKKSFSGSPSFIYITLSFFSFFLVVSAGAGWVMYEKRRGANIRQRKRILNERHSLKNSSKEMFTEDENVKKAGIVPIDQSHKSKVNENSSSSNDDSELGRLFYDSMKTSSKTTCLEQSNHSVLDQHASHKSGLDYSASARLIESGTFKTSQREISEIVSTDNDDAKNVTRIIEQPSNEHPHVFSKKSIGNTRLSFHKSATKIMVGKVDISDSENSSSESVGESSRSRKDNNPMCDKKPSKSLASPSATVPQELLPNHKRNMFTSAIKNASSSLMSSRKPSLKMNIEGDRTERRSRTTQNKTVKSGAQTKGIRSLLTQRSVPFNAASSNSLDNHSSPPDFSEEPSPACPSDMYDGASETRIAMSDDQHFPIDTSSMQRLSQEVDSDSDDDSSGSSSSRSSGSDYSSSESSPDAIHLKNNDGIDFKLDLTKNCSQSCHLKRGEGSARPTMRQNRRARDRNLRTCDPAPKSHKERLSSGAVNDSKSSSDRRLRYEKPLQRLQSEGLPKEIVHCKQPSMQKHKTERRISFPEPTGVDNQLRPHPHAISEPHLFSGPDVPIAEPPMHWLGYKKKNERRKLRTSKGKSKSELRKYVSNSQHVQGEASKKIKHPSKSHSHANRVHHHLKGGFDLRTTAAYVPRGQVVNKKLEMARVEAYKRDNPKPKDTAIEAHTDKPNHHKPHLHESIFTKISDCVPRGLESETQKDQNPRPFTYRTKCSKSKPRHDLDHVSKSRMKMRHTSSPSNSSRPRDSLKVSDVTYVKKKFSAHQDPPARSESRKQNSRKIALEKLNSLKSSLQSSLKGTKLSGAATSILECADVTNDNDDKQEKKLKARSMKSLQSARASELSSSNLNAKPSSYKLSEDVRHKRKHRHKHKPS